jgi:hypothetical protein
VVTGTFLRCFFVQRLLEFVRNVLWVIVDLRQYLPTPTRLARIIRLSSWHLA